MPGAETDFSFWGDFPLSSWTLSGDSLSRPLSILVCCMAVLLAIPRFARIFSESLTCYVRWKECVHLYDSPSKSRSCLEAALLLSLPFICLSAENSLHPLVSIWGDTHIMRLLGALAIVTAFFAMHRLLYGLCRIFSAPDSSGRRALEIAISADHPFFMLCSALMTTTAAVAMFLPDYQEIARHILLWELGISYGICFIRKFQIFASYRNFFAAFLYLCTLEILPCGALVVSALL